MLVTSTHCVESDSDSVSDVVHQSDGGVGGAGGDCMGPDRGTGLTPIVTALPLVGGAHSMVTVDRPTPCVDLPTRTLLGGPVIHREKNIFLLEKGYIIYLQLLPLGE